MHKNGFTLVELAIVLVIIGLIVGGILTGTMLIRSAEIRSTISERDNIQAAINTFRTRYHGLPGDMRNATRFWGAAAPTHAACIALATPTTDGSTCNGNGDKRIFSIPTLTFYETFRALQQLSNAELIPATLTGVTGSDGLLDMDIGENVLGSKIDGAAWLLQYVGNVTAATLVTYAGFMDQFFLGEYSHILGLGRTTEVIPGVGNIMGAPSFDVEEAMAMDLKIDDGKPGTGILKSWRPMPAGPYKNDCATSTDHKTAQYNVGAGNECVLLFKVRF